MLCRDSFHPRPHSAKPLPASGRNPGKKPNYTRPGAMSKAEARQRANCGLTVKQFMKPTEEQKFLFVQDEERIGALRTSFLKNGLLTSAPLGKSHAFYGYQPKLHKMTHGTTNFPEGSVAECLSQWDVYKEPESSGHGAQDFVKINKNALSLGLVKVNEQDTYRKNIDIRQKRKVYMGRRDQTIFYPKGVYLGKPSEHSDHIHDIIAHTAQKQWLQKQKAVDAARCAELVSAVSTRQAAASTRTSEVRSAHNMAVYRPPGDTPLLKTRVRREAAPAVSSFWNTCEVQNLLRCHPEAAGRTRLFGLPSASDPVYLTVHNPECLDKFVKLPPLSDLTVHCQGEQSESQETDAKQETGAKNNDCPYGHDPCTCGGDKKTVAFE